MNTRTLRSVGSEKKKRPAEAYSFEVPSPAQSHTMPTRGDHWFVRSKALNSPIVGIREKP